MSEEKSLLSKIGNVALNAGAAITGAVGTVREIQDMHIDYAVKEKTYELIDKLMSVQQKQVELQELLMASNNKIIELEQEINNTKQWDNEKLNYELFYSERSTVVFRLKPSNNLEQKTHYLCTNCYDDNIKSILQYKTSSRSAKTTTLICHKCKSEYIFPTRIFYE